MINKIYKRALRLIYQDNSNFEILLKKQREFAGSDDWNLLNSK